jgi:excisionase family DNA binding protein
MSEVELLEKLADPINRLTKPAIPLSIDLWDIATISRYLKRDTQVVRERIAVVPSFPRPIRLPAKKGLAHPLFKAAEIIAWPSRCRNGRRSNDRPLITAKEAADIMGISVGAVYDRAAPRGSLPCYRFGGALRFDPADVDAYMQSCRCEPVARIKMSWPLSVQNLKALLPGEYSLLKCFRKDGLDPFKAKERRDPKVAKLASNTKLLS